MKEVIEAAKALATLLVLVGAFILVLIVGGYR